MEFYPWTTLFQEHRKQSPKLSYDQFIKQRIKEEQIFATTGEVSSSFRWFVEFVWHNEGQAYYNIHPQLVPKLCKIDLTKIPSTLFQMPHGRNGVHIRFSQPHPEFTTTETPQTTQYGLTPQSFCRGFLMADNRHINWGRPLSLSHNQPQNQNQLAFLIAFQTPNNEIDFVSFGIQLNENVSLEQALQRTPLSQTLNNNDNENIYQYMESILRLAVTIGFLSNNPTLCEHDILNKDRPKYDTGTDQERQIIISRAQRRGKNGYNIGTDIMFLTGDHPRTSQTHDPTGKQLQYAHIRAGHPHAYRYGPGKNLVKIKWLPPTTVRNDLPFKPE